MTTPDPTLASSFGAEAVAYAEHRPDYAEAAVRWAREAAPGPRVLMAERTFSTDVELVIFDCDGVLVDSEPIAVGLNVQLGRELGWELTADEVLHLFIGRSAASNRDRICEQLGSRVADIWHARFDERHRQAVETELAPVSGIVEALARIPLPTCVASSGTHEKIRGSLGLTGLHERFEGRIFSATEVTHGKPAPDLFLHAADRMGVPPERCIVVEDSRYGVAAARAAGMRSLGYCGGLTPREWLEGPDTVVFDDMRHLPRLLGCDPVGNTR